MAVQELLICASGGPTRRDEVVRNPAWSEVEAAVRALDNATRNDVYLRLCESIDDTWLSVAGGAGRYLVTGVDGGARFPTRARGDGSAEGMVSLVVGGQPGEYPALHIVDLDAALRAARAFLLAGSCSGGIEWEWTGRTKMRLAFEL